MINSLDISDTMSDTYINSFQLSDYNNNNTNNFLSSKQFHHNNLASSNSVDCIYQHQHNETSIDDEHDDPIDLSINHLNFNNNQQKNLQITEQQGKNEHHVTLSEDQVNRIKIFAERTSKTVDDTYMNEENSNVQIQNSDSDLFINNTSAQAFHHQNQCNQQIHQYQQQQPSTNTFQKVCAIIFVQF